MLIIISRQPGANIIETVDRVKALMPQFEASLPPTIHLSVDNDRTGTIRASVIDAEKTMCISMGLVVIVVFVFLRNGWATLIPSISVPVSLIGTFGVMYLLDYTLDNLSLMALTIATGFVVDDAIVVIENITALHRTGRAADAGGAEGRAGNRLHCAFDERFADRGFYPDSDDGGNCGAFVPRIRRGAQRGHFHVDDRVTDGHAR